MRPGFGPMGRFSHMREFPAADFKTVVRLNFDTLCPPTRKVAVLSTCHLDDYAIAALEAGLPADREWINRSTLSLSPPQVPASCTARITMQGEGRA